MKHLIFFAAILTISIAKPTDEGRLQEEEPSVVLVVKVETPKHSSKTFNTLQSHGNNQKISKLSTDVEPLQAGFKSIKSSPKIKRKIIRNSKKRRYINDSTQSKFQEISSQEEPSSLTFSLDSDDTSLSSIISTLIRLIEESEEASESNSTVTTSENTEAFKNVSDVEPFNLAELLETPHSKPEIRMQSKPSHETLDKSLVNENSQSLSQEPTKLLSPESSTISAWKAKQISKIEKFQQDIASSNKDAKNQENSASTPSPILKFEWSNEESSGNFGIEYVDDLDLNHYCPDGVLDEIIKNEDAYVDLEALLLPKLEEFSSTKKPSSISKTKPKLSSTLEAVTDFPESLEILNKVTTESETLDISTELSEKLDFTTSQPTNAPDVNTPDLEDFDDSYTTLEPSTVYALALQPFETTTEIQTETYTEAQTERQADAPTSESLIFSEYSTDHESYTQTTPSAEIFEGVNEKLSQTTTECLQNYIINEFSTETDSTTILSTTTSEAPEVTTEFKYFSSSDLLDEITLPTQSLTLTPTYFSELNQYSTSLGTESVVEPTTLSVVETETRGNTLNSLTEVSTQGIKFEPSTTTTTIASVTPSTTTAKPEIMQIAKVSSTLASTVSSLATAAPLMLPREDPRITESTEKYQLSSVSATKPKDRSRLITFTVYDRKEGYTSLRHFIDYIKALKK